MAAVDDVEFLPPHGRWVSGSRATTSVDVSVFIICRAKSGNISRFILM